MKPTSRSDDYFDKIKKKSQIIIKRRETIIPPYSHLTRPPN